MVYHACVYVYRYVINDAERGLNPAGPRDLAKREADGRPRHWR